MSEKLDILVFAAHPDDAELGCGGSIAKAIKQGKKVGICDLTQGEMGTRGSAELRLEESRRAAKLFRLRKRLNLDLGDCFFEVNQENTMKLVEVIREFQPDVVLTNAPEDRHPDHGRGCEIAELACFWSGLRKIKTDKEIWRPKQVYQYIQDRLLKPDFVVDITEQWDKKIETIKAFASQFYDPDSKEPESYISSKDFFEFIETRAREYGHMIGVKYGEGFVSKKTLEIKGF